MEPETWFFLRGLTRQAAHWGSFPENFVKNLPNATSAVIELPGFGQRRGAVSPSSIAGIAADVVEQVRFATGAKYLVALSLGGMVALEILEKYPTLFSGIVVMNTSAAGVNRIQRRISFKTATAIAIGERMNNPADQEALLLSFLANDSARIADELPLWIELAEKYPYSVSNGLRQLFAAASFRVPFRNQKKPDIPLLFLASGKDRLVDYRCSIELSRALQSPIKVHPTAGHELPLDAPDWLMEQLLIWRSKI